MVPFARYADHQAAGQPERRPTQGILRIELGALLDEELHDVHLASHRRAMEGRAAGPA